MSGARQVQDWPGDSIPIRAWLDAVDIACLIGGIDPAADASAFFSEGHYQHVAETYPDLVRLIAQKRIVFVDSITDLKVHTRVNLGPGETEVHTGFTRKFLSKIKAYVNLVNLVKLFHPYTCACTHAREESPEKVHQVHKVHKPRKSARSSV